MLTIALVATRQPIELFEVVILRAHVIQVLLEHLKQRRVKFKSGRGRALLAHRHLIFFSDVCVRHVVEEEQVRLADLMATLLFAISKVPDEHITEVFV